MSTLMKNNGLMPTTFFDDFLTRNLFDWSGWTKNAMTVPEVNIMETNDDFHVELAAPGMKKDDFQIELADDTLTISSTVSDSGEDKESGHNYIRKEYGYAAFRRSFYLPNTVEVEKIEARYEDGVLHLVIPKKEEARKRPVKTIAIS